MESPPAKPPLLNPPWLRVIVFVLLYLVINLLAYRLLDSGASAFTAFADQIGKISGSDDREFNFILLTLLTS
ncbi:MAG TPA: hypothetical protein VFN95_12555, partial [Flavitalea sp.]|nr:hypothetical protein [Flavitalea sp.]